MIEIESFNTQKLNPIHLYNLYTTRHIQAMFNICITTKYNDR